MDFGDFLGNHALKQTLSAAAAQDRFSHFYLLSGPRGSGKHTLARVLTAAMLCTGADPVPCRRCAACRKVFAGTHPDVITVDDPERKIIPVDLIRKAREDLFIRPNEGKRKIYFLPRAQDLNPSGQNALLKVLEEPPVYGVFLLLTDSPEKLLPTVRSRCTELRLAPLESKLLEQRLRVAFPREDPTRLHSAILRSGGYLGQALELLEHSDLLPQTQQFVQAYAQRDPLALLEVLVPMEKLKRDSLIAVLEQWRQVVVSALSGRAGLPELYEGAALLRSHRTGAELTQAAGTLAQAMEYAQGNVSPGAICGALAWRLR